MIEENIFIIKGVKSTDELSKLGMLVAKQYSRASIVIFLEKSGRYKVMKSMNKCNLDYFDATTLL